MLQDPHIATLTTIVNPMSEGMDHPLFLVLLTLLLLTGCAHQLPIKPSPESDPVHSDQTESALISDPLESVHNN